MRFLLLSTISIATVLANVQYAVPPPAVQYPSVVQYTPPQPQQVPVPVSVPVYNYQPAPQVIVQSQPQPQPQPQQYAIQLGNRATVTNCKACAWCCVGNVPIRRIPIAAPQPQAVPVYTYQQQQQQQQPTRQVVYNQVVSRPQPQPQPISYAPFYTPQQPPPPQQQQQVISRPAPVPAPVPVYYPRPQVIPPAPQPQPAPVPVYTPYQVPPQQQVYNQTSYVQSPPVPTPCQYVAPPPPTTTQGYVAPPPPCQTTTTTTTTIPPPFYVTPTTTTTTTTTTTPPPFYQTAPPQQQDQYETPVTYATPPTYPPPPSTYVPPKSYVQPPTYVPVPLSYRTYPFDIVGGQSTNCCYLKIHNVQATVSCGTTGTQCCTNPLNTCENARNITVEVPRELLNFPPTVITCEEAVRRGFITNQVFEGLCPIPTPASPSQSTEIHVPSTNEPTNVVPTSYVLPGVSGLENSSTISTVTAALTIVIAMFL